jgi:uncharacterized iron-regulated protein
MRYVLALVTALWAVSAGQNLAQEVTLQDLPTSPPAQIIILGEIHDNPTHHLTQAELVSRWAPAAVVFEMLSPEQAVAANAADRSDASAMAGALAWDGTGWPDYALYHPIFAASGSARIYGAALDRGLVRRAISEGAAAVFGADAGQFGLSTPLSAAEQSARQADQLSAHCDALPADMLPGMVEAQRLRDAAFARTALTALGETGGPVVVITGSGHADRLRGIPAALAAAAPDIPVFSLGQVEGDAKSALPFDRWIVTAPIPRPDPCAGFGKS